MPKGIDIELLRPTKTKDRFGNEVSEYLESEVISNVLVVPGSTSDFDASRPEGVSVALTLHFPKTYEGSLERCLVKLPSPWDETYRVIGNPLPYMAENTPGKWNRPVEVEAVHG